MFRRKDKLVGTLFNLVENTIKNSVPKYIKYDTFWNMYYNETKIDNYYDCKLRVYNHHCKDKNLYNTKTMIKYNNNDYDERIFYIDNNGLVRYELEKNGKMIEKEKIEPDLVVFLTKIGFMNKMRQFIEKNVPGRCEWTKELIKESKMMYLQNLFYFEKEEVLKEFVEVIKKIIYIEKGEIIFKYNMTIRQKILYEEYEKLESNKDFQNNKYAKEQVRLFIELDVLFD